MLSFFHELLKMACCLRVKVGPLTSASRLFTASDEIGCLRSTTHQHRVVQGLGFRVVEELGFK